MFLNKRLFIEKIKKHLCLCFLLLFTVSCASNSFNQPLDFDEISDYSEGLALVRLDAECGYINTKQQIVIPIKFNQGWNFSEGLAAVSLTIRYKKVSSCIMSCVEKWGFINKKGEFVIFPQFDLAMDFNNGIAPVMLNEKWGFINKDAMLFIEPQFQEVGSSREFKSGLLRVMLNDKWGFINKQGRVLIPAIYDKAEPFLSPDDPSAEVELNGEEFEIDRTGKKVQIKTKKTYNCITNLEEATTSPAP